MANIKLCGQPADFERLGVNLNGIEVWEDGGREKDSLPNHWEWWYSDFIFDDGMTAVVQFFPKEGTKLREGGDHPQLHLRIRFNCTGRNLFLYFCAGQVIM